MFPCKVFQNTNYKNCASPTYMAILRRTVHRKSKLKRVKINSNDSLEGTSKPEMNLKSNNEVFFNPCNIQMIPESLHRQIFPDKPRKETSKVVLEKCEAHLKKHGLWGLQTKPLEPMTLKIPELEGENIEKHFYNIAMKQIQPYEDLTSHLIDSVTPQQPKRWNFEEGWTKYGENDYMEKVPYPDADVLVFDVEVCLANGQRPTLACALSPTNWYSWCSGDLINGLNRDSEEQKINILLNDLIPLETDCVNGSGLNLLENKQPKLVVGHNVSYDRSRIKEQYFLPKSKLRFLDTMSLHIAVSGITSYQRALKMTLKSKNKGVNKLSQSENSVLGWNSSSSLNNLVDVHQLYCGGPGLTKDKRDMFVKCEIKEISNHFQELTSYCANDVVATLEIFRKLFPVFKERFPHPVTMAGMLHMGSTYLPVNTNWELYKKLSEDKYIESGHELKSILMAKADEALLLMENDAYKKDPWLWDMDWSLPKRRMSHLKKPLPLWYRKLLPKLNEIDGNQKPTKISPSMQVVPKLLRLTWYGFPLHYFRTEGWGFLIKRINLSENHTSENKFVSMDELEEETSFEKNGQNLNSKFPFEKWEEIYELAKAEFTKKFVAKPSSSKMDSVRQKMKNKPEEMGNDIKDFIRGLEAITGQSFSDKSKHNSTIQYSPHPLCQFVPLPHKDGLDYKVGNPLAKDFLSKIEEGILSCGGGEGKDLADRVVKISNMTSYWRNNRDRILGQIVVWTTYSPEKVGAILPQVVVSGTLTRRAVEPTWMTASNAYVDRIGSELKSMIQAPQGYCFVGADVDSQELWIASIIGDSYFLREHGCTALGWMTLQGNKSAGTDMHSMTAKVSGIARDQAKILNYARIYGAGVSFAERLLLQFNKSMTTSEAKSKAKKMFEMTKGNRKYLLSQEGIQLLEELALDSSNILSKKELQELLNYHNIPFNVRPCIQEAFSRRKTVIFNEWRSYVHKTVWDGGTESFMFNSLEDIAQSSAPHTPILKGLISRSLTPEVVHDQYMTSRINWVVQSSAVDFLHLMLTCMEWLMEKFQLSGRFSLSVHDEVRFLAKENQKYEMALALHITNLLTRSFCSYQLGMYDLPQSVAFFSCVDIDTVLRKEVTDNCVTPSNPQGLVNGYNIPDGEALDIKATLALTKGKLSTR